MHDDTETRTSKKSQQPAAIILLIAGVLGIAVLGGVVWLLNAGDDGPTQGGSNPQIVFKPLPSRSDAASPPTLEPSATPSTPIVVKEAPIPIPNLIQPLDKATFLGTQAEGRRFCIVADASNSMRGAPLEQVKVEILKTLTGLNATSQFYIIYFHATDAPMPYPNWLAADKDNIEKVRPWVQNVKTVLGTLPASSFRRAFKLDPKPDVIFLMTDGVFGKKEDIPAVLRSLNASEPKVQIHTILFSKAKAAKIETASAQLRLIAEKNAGTFRRVTQK